MGKAFGCVSSILSTIFALTSAGLLTALLAYSAFLIKKEGVEARTNAVFVLTIFIAILSLVCFIVMLAGSWSRKRCCMVFNLVLVLVFGLLWAVVGLICLFQPARALTLIEKVWTGKDFKGYELAVEAKLQCCGWNAPLDRCPAAASFCLPVIDAFIQKDRKAVGFCGLIAAALAVVVIFLKAIHCCCVRREQRRVGNAYDGSDSEVSLKEQKKTKKTVVVPPSETYSDSSYYYDYSSSSSTPPPPPKKKGKNGRRH